VPRIIKTRKSSIVCRSAPSNFTWCYLSLVFNYQ